MATHEAPGSTFWDRIRAGAEQAAKQHGIDLKYSNDPDSGKQATLIQNAVDSKVDGIAVTLANPDAVGPALQKATEAGIPGVVFNAGIAGAAQAQAAAGTSAKIVTFDLSPEVVQAIKDKKIEFSVDQQPYLQGYEAVDSLWLQLSNGNDIGGGKPTLTGPSFVDATNIDKIAGFAANNTR